MSIFDYIGLAICALFFTALAIAVVLDFIYEISGPAEHSWLKSLVLVVIFWICYDGLEWVYYY